MREPKKVRTYTEMKKSCRGLREHNEVLKNRIKELEVNDTRGLSILGYNRLIDKLEAKLANFESDAYVLSLLTKLDAVKALRDELEARELAQYPEHEVSLAWLVIKLDEAIGE